jgi:dTDP-4-dehydrorhamnose reductase
MTELNNASILLVGASGGLGREMAQILHGKGAVLTLAGRDHLALQAVGVPANIVTGDVTEPGVVDDFVAAAVEHGGKLDGVIYAAGVVAFAGRATPADFAALAPRLLDAATAGDGTALALLRQGADYIARGVNRLGWQPGEALCPIGGLAASYTPYLPAPMASSLVDPQGSALDGALALAARIAAEGAAP